MTESLKQIVSHTHSARPMVHSITNNVTINDCANIILAAGGTAIIASLENAAAALRGESGTRIVK